MRTVYQSTHFTVTHDPTSDVLYIQRSAHPYGGLDEIPRVFAELMAALRPLSSKPALSDLREARGNNDPAWEATVRPLVQRLYGMFPALAVLVKTAAGKLHTQRLARERGASGDNVFTDEAEALAYLAARRR
jgi:hypothetical protein